MHSSREVKAFAQGLSSRQANAPVAPTLITYGVVTFGGAWLVWTPLLLGEYAGLTLPVPPLALILLGSFAPTVAALLFTGRSAGWSGLRRLLGQALHWRVSGVWYLLAIAGPAGVMLLAMGGHVLLGGTAPPYTPLGARWLLVAVNLVLILVIGGPLGEEFGWRGYVLPRLEARWGPLWASLGLGVIWAAWHLPLFFVSASAQHSVPFGLYALLAPPLSVVMTWVYYRSGHSLLLAMLFHGAVNTWSGTLQIGPDAAGSTRPLVFVVLTTWVVALAIVSGGGLGGRRAKAQTPRRPSR